ncbi:MAG: hypothetical protein AAGE99_02505 [Chlamydiota bacterium]
MITRRLIHLFFLLPLSLWAIPQECTVHLKNPEYRDGIVSTHQGGIIVAPELRVQARQIVYVDQADKEERVHRFIAQGDLMLNSGGHTYVGRRLEYDFITKTGIVYDGVAAIDLWFLGGEKIRLNADRSFYLYNAFVTTSDSKNADWKIHSRELDITKKTFLAAKNVTFRFFETPIFWLPSFKSNLKTFSESPVRYRLDWDTNLRPKVSIRYRVYSWERLDLYLRLNVRPSKGIGGAVETDYKSFDRRKKFRTRSYLDHDTFYRDTDPDKATTRYRFQGRYESSSENEQARVYGTYDWLSDKNMQNDFRSGDFELNTPQQTKMIVRNYRDRMIFGIDGTVRIHRFQGMKQELPESFWTSKPFVLGQSGIISENRAKVAYLDYISAKDIESAVPDFRAARLSIRHSLYRPFRSHGFALTPTLGINGLFYGDSRKDRPVALGVLTYELVADLTLKRNDRTFRHLLKPYIRYRGMTYPTISPDTPYIFSIDDGLNRLNAIRFGIRNLFYFKKTPLFEPNIIADLYAYGFLGENTFKKTIPKLQGNFIWNFPCWRLTGLAGWNIEKQVLDYTNLGLAWTIDENFAFKTEFRHRSRFDWRKADPENFIMEVTRDIRHLEDSPLSDRRNTLLTRLQMKLTPQWIARLESHIGWGRDREPRYDAAKVELITMISTGWRLRLIFIRSPTPYGRDHRFTLSLSLVKK